MPPRLQAGAQAEAVLTSQPRVLPTHGDGHDAGIIVEGTLHTVTMMGIKVNIEHPCFTDLKQMSDGNGRIVVHTIARCPVGPGVMPASSWVKDMQRVFVFLGKRFFW